MTSAGRILLAAYGLPGLAEASTQNDRLLRRMRADGHDVVALNVLDELDREYFEIVTGNRPGSSNGRLDVEATAATTVVGNEALRERVVALEPALVVARGSRAAVAIRAVAPNTGLIFMTSGCDSLRRAIGAGIARDYQSVARRIQDGQRLPFRVNGAEGKGVRGADLVVTDSEMTQLLYNAAFPTLVGKIHPAVAWPCPAPDPDPQSCARFARPFAERDIDVLFLASTWNRKGPNWRLARRISSRCKPLRVHVAGAVRSPARRACHHGVVGERDALLSLLGRTRALVSPSRYEASADALISGAAMGCNVVASRNCGSWMLCNEELVVEPYTANCLCRPRPVGRDCADR